MGVKFGFDLFRWQQPFGAETHHDDECETEEHVLPVAGGGEDVVAGDELVA